MEIPMKREQFCRVLLMAAFFTMTLWLGGCNALAGLGRDIQVGARAVGTSMTASEKGEDK